MKFSRLTFSILACSLLLSGCSKLGIGAKNAGLKITANQTSTVTLDGKEAGNTPYESTSQKAGKSSIKITPNGDTGTPFETSLKLYPGYMTQIDWNFGKGADDSFGVSFEYEDARDKNKAEIQLTASPDNVPVVIDGKNVGFTPLLVDTLTEGDHKVLLQAPGYTGLERSVKLVKGVRTNMTGKLAKEPAPAPAPIVEPVATQSAIPATGSAKKATPTPKPSAKPTATPIASSSAKATASPTPAATTNNPSTTTKPYVEILSTPTGWLRVRDTASSTGKELTKLDTGATVPYANASSSGWLKIKYDGTATGWVSSDFAKLVQ